MLKLGYKEKSQITVIIFIYNRITCGQNPVPAHDSFIFGMIIA